VIDAIGDVQEQRGRRVVAGATPGWMSVTTSCTTTARPIVTRFSGRQMA